MLEFAPLILLGVILLLQILLIARMRNPAVPMGVLMQLEQLDRLSKEVQASAARIEGGLNEVVAEVRKQGATQSIDMAPLTEALDQAVARLAAESRGEHGELLGRLQRFEGRLEQRLEGMDAMLAATNKLEGTVEAVATQIQGMAQSTAGGFDPLRDVLDQKLAQVAADSREGRGELVGALHQFESRLEQRLATFDASMSAGRSEVSEVLTGLRDELTKAVGYVAVESTKSRELLVENADRFETRIHDRFEGLTQGNRQVLEALKTDTGTQLLGISAALREQIEGNANLARAQLSLIHESVGQQLAALALGNQQSAEQMRQALDQRLAQIQADNAAKLEDIRSTVDEKLHATLEQRLGESFQRVCERLEQVQSSLGEMHALTAGVGDLKRVLANVKSRGTWGEVQLGALIEQVMSPEQFARNVATRPGEPDVVDFALRLPGRLNEQPVWLPIDAQFPLDEYQQLLDAQEGADEEGMRRAGQALEARFRSEARTLHDKHIAPPHTTDFAIMYLPVEGLFAEALRRPGLAESIQRELRVVLAGPTNLAAVLNSLQMGFKTLSIERRSAEVWALLGAVKSEFGKFGDVLLATQEKLEAATHQFSEVNVRTRAIQRRLQNVEELPKQDMARVLTLVEPAAVGEEMGA